jgi:chromosome segregation ATPase
MDYKVDENEVYHAGKNLKKLNYSNRAYQDNMARDKIENEEEIKNLKREYEKVKNEVIELRKKTLYNAGSRIKSASSNPDNQNSELLLLRSKLDYIKNEKIKSKEEWKRLDERLSELKSESKYLNDDNNPYMRKIKLLENKLDKAMIKYNEAMSIRRTYEQILTRLKEEKAGYDNQIMAIQKSLKAKEHDSDEFKALLQDATQAKTYSQLLLKNAELSVYYLFTSYNLNLLRNAFF